MPDYQYPDVQIDSTEYDDAMDKLQQIDSDDPLLFKTLVSLLHLSRRKCNGDLQQTFDYLKDQIDIHGSDITTLLDFMDILDTRIGVSVDQIIKFTDNMEKSNESDIDGGIIGGDNIISLVISDRLVAHTCSIGDFMFANFQHTDTMGNIVCNTMYIACPLIDDGIPTLVYVIRNTSAKNIITDIIIPGIVVFGENGIDMQTSYDNFIKGAIDQERNYNVSGITTPVLGAVDETTGVIINDIITTTPLSDYASILVQYIGGIWCVAIDYSGCDDTDDNDDESCVVTYYSAANTGAAVIITDGIYNDLDKCYTDTSSFVNFVKAVIAMESSNIT